MSPVSWPFRHLPGRRLVQLAVSGSVLAIGACSGVNVRTVVAPDANFSGRHTFRLMGAPVHRANTRLASSDPLLVNSITYRRIRSALEKAFEERAYTPASDGADLAVAYYATAQQKLDLRTWDYGYSWRGFPRQRTEAYQYEEGTVLVDVIDPVTRKLLWRGQGKAAVSTDPEKYAEQLEKTVRQIVAKFPKATG